MKPQNNGGKKTMATLRKGRPHPFREFQQAIKIAIYFQFNHHAGAWTRNETEAKHWETKIFSGHQILG